jgi:peptidoglycan/LPS O-acetylase OafA/YrhL
MPSLAAPSGHSPDSSSKPALVPVHRLGGLDGLRAISIGLVIFSHVIATNHLQADSRDNTVEWGRVGVDMFFVLSGFLITWLLLKEKSSRGRVSLKAFYLRRAFRILPPAMLYLAAMAVLTAVGIYHLPAGDFGACILFVRNIYSDHPFLYHYYSDQTSHYWSLSVEEQFYLLWPLLLVIGGGKIARRTGWWVALVPLGAIYLDFHGRKHPIFSFLGYFAWFGPILVGCLLALYRDANSPIRHFFSAIGRYGWIPLAATVGAILSNYLPHVHLFVTLAYSAAFALIINSLIEAPSSFAGRMLNLRPVSYLGRLSYSLYLWQQMFCWADPNLPRRWWECFPLNIALACLLAMLSYHLVELPILRLRDRIMKPDLKLKR